MDALPPDKETATKDSGEAAAGLSNRRRLEQQEHQHKLQRASVELESSSGMNPGMGGGANSVPAVRPYATEQSLKVAGRPGRKI